MFTFNLELLNTYTIIHLYIIHPQFIYLLARYLNKEVTYSNFKYSNFFFLSSFFFKEYLRLDLTTQKIPMEDCALYHIL